MAKSVWSVLLSKPHKKGKAKKSGNKSGSKGNAWAAYVGAGKRR
jgi:hypothetical protein